MIDPRPDLRGIDQVFNFLAVPGPATCFQGVQYLQPGEYVRVRLGATGRPARVSLHRFWQIEFPDRGQEERGSRRPNALVDELEDVLLGAVERRLRADVPVVSYLSGGIDSSLVVAMATKIRGTPIPTFTIQIRHPRFDETSQAAIVSRHIGSKPLVVSVGDEEVLRTYAELTHSAEAPVVDTSCIALLLLARAVHRQGYKVALTGEGGDEWLAGYPWYKLHRLADLLDAIPPLRFGRWVRHAAFRVTGSAASMNHIRSVASILGDHTAFQEFYSLVSLSRQRFYSHAMLDALRDYSPYLELEPNPDRVLRWHPVNRALYWGARIHLAGHLLTLKGDRIAMNSSVEMRYPYLDEQTFDTLARIHPRWKLRRFRDKYILRRVGERYLPRQVAWRPKGMFRAPLDTFFHHDVPDFVEQLLSDESLRSTGYFDIEAVQHWRERLRHGWLGPLQRVSVELGLMGVVATQLWHHTFIDNTLAELPTRAAARISTPRASQPVAAATLR